MVAMKVFVFSSYQLQWGYGILILIGFRFGAVFHRRSRSRHYYSSDYALVVQYDLL